MNVPVIIQYKLLLFYALTSTFSLPDSAKSRGTCTDDIEPGVVEGLIPRLGLAGILSGRYVNYIVGYYTSFGEIRGCRDTLTVVLSGEKVTTADLAVSLLSMHYRE